MIISIQLNSNLCQQKRILPCRIEGLFKEAMTAALQLPLHDDCTTALQLAGQLIQVQALHTVLCVVQMQAP